MSQSSPSSRPEAVSDASAQSDHNTPPRSGRPLAPATGPFTPFPVDALVPFLADAARAIEDIVQAPMAMCAQSVFAVAAAVVQAYLDAIMPMGGDTTRPTSEFFLTIARSGERKSEVDRLATKGLHLYQARLMADYLASARAKAAGLNIQSPPKPTMMIEDVTMEGLIKLMADNQPSYAMFSDEAGKFLQGHSMSEEARIRTAATLCGFWDGKPASRIRASAEPLYLPGRRVSAHLMVQPMIGAKLLGDAGMVDQGLTSRFLISEPESRIGKRAWKEASPASSATLDSYNQSILDRLALPRSFDDDEPNVLKPRGIRLSSQARQAFIGFYDDIEMQVVEGGMFAPIVSLANKSAEHAIRLSAVQAWIEDPDASEISAEIFDRGVALMRYYLSEALRLVSAAPVSAKLDLAKITLDWLHTKWTPKRVSLADFCQRGPGSIRSKAVAVGVIQVLEEHDWLTRVAGSGSNRDMWEVTR